MMRRDLVSKSKLEEIALRGREDPVEFLRTFLPHWFPGPIPWVHRGILAINLRQTNFLKKYGELDKIVKHFGYYEDPFDENSKFYPMFEIIDGEVYLTVSRFTEIMMPRGFSKTTLANGESIFRTVYKLNKFITYISESASHAETQLANVKEEFETNEAIIAVWGELRPPTQSSRRWAHDVIDCNNGVTIAARGRGGQIRGMLRSSARPDHVILDDIEDEESVKTPEQRDKTKQWFYKAVRPLLPRQDKNATMVVQGTLLGRQSLLATLAYDPAFTTIRFGSIDKDGEALWPEHMPLQDIEQEKMSFAAAGELRSFYTEFMNQIRDDETAKFRPSFFIHDSISDPSNLVKAIAIDPAISDKAGADFTSIAVVGMEPKGKIWVLDMWGKVGATPREQVDKFFELHAKWNPKFAGVEAIAYQAALVHLLQEEMFRRKRYFEITRLTHSQKKVERVEGILQPRYANGYIIHARRFPELESQLLDWPNGKKDFPDALSMAVSLLDPAAPMAATGNLEEDEFEDIDLVIGSDWRTM